MNSYDDNFRDDYLVNCEHPCPRCEGVWEHELDKSSHILPEECAVDEDREICPMCQGDTEGCVVDCPNLSDQDADHAMWCINNDSRIAYLERKERERSGASN